MATRSLEERIAENLKKQEELKAQEKVLRKKQSDAERKARTKRLVEMGGIVSHVLGRELTDDDKIKFLINHNITVSIIQNRIFTTINIIEQINKTQQF